MNFKEQLIKHENILNKYKALYINKENQNDNDNNNNNIKINSNSISSENIISFNNNFCEKNKVFNDEENINKNISNKASNIILNNNINNQENSISFNNNNNLDLKCLPQERQHLISNSNKNEKTEEDINLEKIDNLLAKLNFKRENDLIISKKPMNNIQENNSISIVNPASNVSNDNLNKTNMSVIDNNNFNKLDITSIKAKYENNKNSFNITQKFFDDANDENQNNDNNKLNTINNIKKLNQLNARNEIERIKAKYYTMNLNKNNNNYLDNNYVINNNINNSFVQLNKEIIEIKNKLDSYRNDLKLSYQNIIKNSIDSYIQTNDIKTKYNEEKEINIYNKNIINNNNDNNLYNKDNIESTKQISFKNNIPNLNIKSFDINNDLKETKRNMLNDYEDNINDTNSENNSNNINEVKNKNNFNNINNNESINNDYNNDFDYSEVLPIVDKVSKLKELNDIDEDFENQKSNNLFSDRTKITNINVNQNNNEEDEVPNIVNSILDALSNKLISSNIDYEKKKDQKFEKENDNLTKPKIIPKNKNIENKKTKVISFQEFLAKEEKDK